MQGWIWRAKQGWSWGLEMQVRLWLCLFCFDWLTQDCQVGNAATQLSKNSTASSPTSRRKLTKGCLKNSIHFMQRWVMLPYISVIAYWVDTSFSAVLTAPVAMTWIRFVDPSQIGWMWPDPTPLSCWTPTAAVIGELCMMSQDDSYVLQSLIGTTLSS